MMSEQPVKKKCEYPPMFRYFWPGKEPVVACVLHTQQAKNIADAMGFYIHIEGVQTDITVYGHCECNAFEDEGQS